MAYCGAGTKKNKTLWSLVCCLGLACIICVIVYVVVASQKCADDAIDQGCITTKNGYNEYDPNKCYGITSCRVSYILLWVAIILFVLATIPCCIMCCCSRPPSAKYNKPGKHHPAAAPVAHQQDYQTYDAGTAGTAQQGGYDTYGQQGGYVQDQYGGAPHNDTAAAGTGTGYDTYGGKPGKHSYGPAL